jgi:hypothetical protein
MINIENSLDRRMEEDIPKPVFTSRHACWRSYERALFEMKELLPGVAWATRTFWKGAIGLGVIVFSVLYRT